MHGGEWGGGGMVKGAGLCGLGHWAKRIKTRGVKCVCVCVCVRSLCSVVPKGEGRGCD